MIEYSLVTHISGGVADTPSYTSPPAQTPSFLPYHEEKKACDKLHRATPKVGHRTSLVSCACPSRVQWGEQDREMHQLYRQMRHLWQSPESFHCQDQRLPSVLVKESSFNGKLKEKDIPITFALSPTLHKLTYLLLEVALPPLVKSVVIVLKTNQMRKKKGLGEINNRWTHLKLF